MADRTSARLAGAAMLALWILASFPALADTGAALGEDALAAALLRAVTEGQWWIALAIAGGLTIAVLRRQGLIRLRWLAATASIALAVVGGVLHHWLAGVPMGERMLVVAAQIALPMILALIIPPRQPEAPSLSPVIITPAHTPPTGYAADPLAHADRLERAGDTDGARTIRDSMGLSRGQS